MSEKSIKLRRARVITKTSFGQVELTVGLPNRGRGMMQGGTAEVIDIPTGVNECHIKEWDTVYLGPNNKIIAQGCLGCIFLEAVCRAVEL